MGKWCVGQVYFMEKWSKRQGLKIAISQKSSYVKFSMIIFSLFLRTLTVNCFVCFFIYYMCDSSIVSIASPLISLVTRKNEHEINALMKKASIIFKQTI